MSTLGFEEALQGAVGVAWGDKAPVPVASLPGVGVLKLVAWDEAPLRRPQDPVDLCMILLAYHEVVGDRLYGEHADLLEDETFDYRVAGARIYGRDMAPLLRTPTLRGRVLDVLEGQAHPGGAVSLFVARMGKECHPDYAFRLRCLQAMLHGVRDRL